MTKNPIIVLTPELFEKVLKLKTYKDMLNFLKDVYGTTAQLINLLDSSIQCYVTLERVATEEEKLTILKRVQQILNNQPDLNNYMPKIELSVIIYLNTRMFVNNSN